MNRTPRPWSCSPSLMLALGGLLLAWVFLANWSGPAQGQTSQGEETSPPEVTLDRQGETPAEDADSADAVMDEMLRRRQPPPGTAPERDPVREDVPERLGVPAPTVEIDPSVLGIAPGESAPRLRREGEFLVQRRGRLIRSTDGAHILFVFEADAQNSPERPMIMMPCRMLESMEQIAADRGDDAEFILSGEVFVYRKHNYLLPTAMKVAIDRGNLEN